MARSRNIKPGFFLNDELAEVEPLGRILFAGLWCIADREGRLEDKPRRIKVEVLPYDDCDVNYLLNQLAERGFIVRYEHESNPYIQIINFTKHQNPHPREVASVIPAYPCLGNTQALPDKLQGNAEQQSSNADSLISDSLLSDSLIFSPDTTELERNILNKLQSILGYPFDYIKDLSFIRDLAVDYPTIDILEQVKKYSVWLLDNPYKAKSNPRLQFRNWCKNSVKWGDKKDYRASRGDETHYTGEEEKDFGFQYDEV